MKNSENILKAVKFIEDNLTNEITIPDVASAGGYSPYHFCRLFSAITGYSPKEYLLKRRLSEAAKEISKNEEKILSIAFDYQFNSHENFSRAFKKVFGVNPLELKKKKTITDIEIIDPISEYRLFSPEKQNYSDPEFVGMDDFYLTGLVTLVGKNEQIITELWYKFMIDVPNIQNRVIPEKYYQLAFWPLEYDLEGQFFMICVETKDIESISHCLVGKRLPESKYAKFIHKGISKDVWKTMKYIYDVWLPESDRELSFPFALEYYGKKYIGPDNPESESEIYIPIK